MTREEAIELLNEISLENYRFGNVYKFATGDCEKRNKALDVAIKALQAPPNDNWEGYSKRLWKAAYERGKADAKAEPCEDIAHFESNEYVEKRIEDYNRMLKSGVLNCVKEDLQQTCNQLARDLVSRPAALDAFGVSEKTRKYGGDRSGYDTMMLYEIQDILEDLPSVNLQPTCNKVATDKLEVASDYGEMETK